MDTSDLNDEEKKARMQAELALRIKKRNSRIFLTIGSLFEIVETIAVIFGLFILSLFLIIRVANFSEKTAQVLYQASMIVSFVGGLFLGFIIYKACANFVIEKFNLHDKLTEEILSHYSKRYRNAQKEAMKR